MCSPRPRQHRAPRATSPVTRGKITIFKTYMGWPFVPAHTHLRVLEEAIVLEVLKPAVPAISPHIQGHLDSQIPEKVERNLIPTYHTLRILSPGCSSVILASSMAESLWSCPLSSNSSLSLRYFSTLPTWSWEGRRQVKQRGKQGKALHLSTPCTNTSPCTSSLPSFPCP